jgi:hypothetical protein
MVSLVEPLVKRFACDRGQSPKAPHEKTYTEQNYACIWRRTAPPLFADA